MSEFFAVPDRWILPEYVWRQSFEDMAIDGRGGCEGVALWLGTVEDEAAEATQVVLLRGQGVLKRSNQLGISDELMNKVAIAAATRNLILIGQIHSHSPFATTELSYPDRYLGMCEPGYLSLVAPDFALRAATELQDCGVHVHEGASGWRRLSVAETLRRFDRTEGSPRPPLVIGADR